MLLEVELRSCAHLCRTKPKVPADQREVAVIRLLLLVYQLQVVQACQPVFVASFLLDARLIAYGPSISFI